MAIYIIAKYNYSETIEPILLGVIQLDAAYDCEIPCPIRPAAGRKIRAKLMSLPTYLNKALDMINIVATVPDIHT